MNKKLKEDNLYQVIDQFNEKKFIYKVLFNTFKQNMEMIS